MFLHWFKIVKGCRNWSHALELFRAEMIDLANSSENQKKKRSSPQSHEQLVSPSFVVCQCVCGSEQTIEWCFCHENFGC